ncbi:Cutinase [Colletotrichum siamense]|uniref:Cutinase n=1 Tax=Colletotrichum siamense TaxID=690259 RepID=UPI00187291CA|nr:Cutinase [Colletotrichum siamense]KAF5494432.1 Cutinase [Colletotrichum siamense]
MKLFLFSCFFALAASIPHSVPPKPRFDVGGMITMIEDFFPANQTLSFNTTGMDQAWAQIASNFSLSVEENSLQKDRCADIMVVFARGTYEIGNVGVLVGAPFLQVLRELAAPGLTIEMQGVEYAANMTGYQLGGDPEGSQKMADTILTVQNKCPRAKVVVSGYSQGAQLVHNAMKKLKNTTLEGIDAVVTFGDPLYPRIPEGVPGWKMLSV